MATSISICITNKNRSVFSHNNKNIYLLPNTLNSINNLNIRNTKIEIVISDWYSDDLDINDWMKEYITNPMIEYKVIRVKGIFSRGKGRNIAYKNAKYPTVLFLDADILINDGLIIAGIESIKENKAFFPICFMYTDPTHKNGRWMDDRYGINMLTKHMIENTRLWPEQNRWGGEDKQLFDAITEKYMIERERFENLYHMWHPSNVSWKDRFNTLYNRTTTTCKIGKDIIKQKILILNDNSKMELYGNLINRMLEYEFIFIDSISSKQIDYSKYMISLKLDHDNKSNEEIIRQMGLLGHIVICNSNYPNCMNWVDVDQIITFIKVYDKNRKIVSNIIQDSVKRYINKEEPSKNVVLIASYRRHDILKINLELLKMQTQKVHVVCMLDLYDEYIDLLDDDIYIIREKEIKPLGMKWHIGLLFCKLLYPQNIIINGSDDLFSLNWTKYLINNRNEYDQIGTNNWLFYDSINNKLYNTEYADDNKILGAGRLINYKVLNKMDWLYFPHNLNHSMDHYSYINLMKHGKVCSIRADLDKNFVMSYKGSWDMRNPSSIMMNSNKLIMNKISSISEDLNIKSTAIINFFKRCQYGERIILIANKNTNLFTSNYLDHINFIHWDQNNPNIKNLVINNKNTTVWIEWGINYAVQLSKTKFPNNKIMIRIHDYEINTDYMKLINWDNIDLVWFINRQTRQDFYNKYRISVANFHLPNAINTNEFKTNIGKKIYGKNIVTYFVKFEQRKRIDRLIDIFKLLKSQDDGWKLHIRISLFEKSDKAIYTEVLEQIKKYNLEDDVFINIPNLTYNDIKGKADIVEYLSDKDIFISASEHEAFHYAIGESMLCGLKPIVYNWEWGRAKDFWGNFVFDEYNDIVQDIINWSKLSNEKKNELSTNYKKYVEDRYSSKILSKKLLCKLKNNKKILYVSYNSLKVNIRGGETSSNIILKYLENNGYHVNVIIYTKYPVNSDEIHCETYDELKDNILKIDPDLILTHNLPAIDVAKICLELDIPYILFIRWFSLIQPLPPGDLMERPINNEFVENRKYIFDNAAEIFTNNYYSIKIIERYYNRMAKCTYVPIEYVPTEYVNGNVNGSILIVSPIKDLGEKDLIIDLSLAMPNENILIVNYNKHDFDNYKNITILPYQENMTNIYKQTKVLLYPMYKNDVCGTSRVLMEAYAFGIPVIANSRSGFDEKCLLSVSKDALINEWVDMISAVSENYEVHSKNSYNAFLNYDSYTEMDKIVDAIDNILFT